MPLDPSRPLRVARVALRGRDVGHRRRTREQLLGVPGLPRPAAAEHEDATSGRAVAGLGRPGLGRLGVGGRGPGRRRPRRRGHRVTRRPVGDHLPQRCAKAIGGLGVADGGADPPRPQTGERLAAADGEAVPVQSGPHIGDPGVEQDERRRRGRHHAHPVDPREPAKQVSALGRQTVSPRLDLAGGRVGCGGDARLQRRRGDRPRRLRRRQQPDDVRCGQQVADPQPGQRPRLGQASDHHQPVEVADARERLRLARQAVGEGLVDDHDPPRAHQLEQRVPWVGDGGRVGRVADEDQVRVGRDQRRVKRERERQDHPVDLVPGGAQGGLRLGELGVDDDRVPGLERARQQDEGLGGAGGEQHLVRRPAMAGRDRRDRRALVRVRGQIRLPDPGGEPAGRPR